MEIQLLNLILSCIRLIPSRNPSCLIEPRQIEAANSDLKIIIENLGPGPVHEIKLKTFGMKSIEVNEKKKKMRVELGMSKAEGPSALKQNESGAYLISWEKYEASNYPFSIEWKNSFSKKTKSVWVINFNNKVNKTQFIPIKKNEIRRMFEEIFFISIFKRKQFIKYNPHLIPEEKE